MSFVTFIVHCGLYLRCERKESNIIPTSLGLPNWRNGVTINSGSIIYQKSWCPMHIAYFKKHEFYNFKYQLEELYNCLPFPYMPPINRVHQSLKIYINDIFSIIENKETIKQMYDYLNHPDLLITLAVNEGRDTVFQVFLFLFHHNYYFGIIPYILNSIVT